MISHHCFSIHRHQPARSHRLSVFTDPRPLCWSQGWVQRCACRSYRRCVCQSGRCVCGCSPSGWRGTETLWQQLDTPASTGSWLSHTSKCASVWKRITVRVHSSHFLVQKQENHIPAFTHHILIPPCFTVRVRNTFMRDGEKLTQEKRNPTTIPNVFICTHKRAKDKAFLVCCHSTMAVQFLYLQASVCSNKLFHMKKMNEKTELGGQLVHTFLPLHSCYSLRVEEGFRWSIKNTELLHLSRCQ